MLFQPKTEQEIYSDRVLPKGVYPFAVKSAVEKKNVGGVPSILLVLDVAGGDGKTRSVYDELKASELGKVLQISMACGMADKYQQGQLSPADFVGKTGHCHLVISPGRDPYPDKNKVAAYVAKAVSARR